MNRSAEKNKLTDAHREYVVERLAAFDSPAEIASSLKQEFGVSVTRQAVDRYDPTRSPRCRGRWKLLFFATRQAIIDGKAARGAANAIMQASSYEHLRRRAVAAMPTRAMTDGEFALEMRRFIERTRALKAGGYKLRPVDRELARVLAEIFRRLPDEQGIALAAEMELAASA